MEWFQQFSSKSPNDHLHAHLKNVQTVKFNIRTKITLYFVIFAPDGTARNAFVIGKGCTREIVILMEKDIQSAIDVIRSFSTCTLGMYP